MGKIGGFKEYSRADESNVAVVERVSNYNEFTIPLSKEKIKEQGSRCMDCGIPFCHSSCPLGNLIPDFNDMVHQEEWESALAILQSTNNFPEFTGRLCPAPCEKSCVLGIIKEPVAIENIEKNIIERGFAEGWIKPQTPATRTGKTVAVVGSGPAGLAAAQQLNRAGHTVTVFERDNAIGGLLRYGIPNFKLEKGIIDRRVAILEAEGITFKTNVHVGVNFSVDELNAFDSVVLCGGATERRGLPTKGAVAKGVVQAMTFLTQQTKVVWGESVPDQIVATGKDVIVIGGGDTGSDCVGTSNRHGAKSVTQFELLPKPPEARADYMPWPTYPMILKTTTSHEEGAERIWGVATKAFIGDEKGNLKALQIVDLEWTSSADGRPSKFTEKEGSLREIPCELALLAMGFLHPQATGMLDELGVELDERGNVKATESAFQTNINKVFTAGDMRRGQSLVVWAIREGRQCARSVDEFLMGSSVLPR